MRYQPPQASKDATGQFAEVAKVLDALDPQAAYAPSLAAIVQVSAGETRRLAPRTAGQTAVIPAADGTTYGKSITLIVEDARGTLTIRPISGTVNGAVSIAYGSGSYLVTLVSSGQGRWLMAKTSATDLAALAGAGLAVNGAALDVTGSTSIVVTGDQVTRAALTGEVTASANANATTVTRSTNFTASPWTGTHQFDATVRFNETIRAVSAFAPAALAAQADDLAIGAVSVVRLTMTGNQNLSGMVPTGADQLVWLQNADAADTLTILHDATSTAANRFVCPNLANYALLPRSATWCRYDNTANRWFIAVGSA